MCLLSISCYIDISDVILTNKILLTYHSYFLKTRHLGGSAFCLVVIDVPDKALAGVVVLDEALARICRRYTASS